MEIILGLISSFTSLVSKTSNNLGRIKAKNVDAAALITGVLLNISTQRPNKKDCKNSDILGKPVYIIKI